MSIWTQKSEICALLYAQEDIGYTQSKVLAGNAIEKQTNKIKQQVADSTQMKAALKAKNAEIQDLKVKLIKETARAGAASEEVAGMQDILVALTAASKLASPTVSPRSTSSDEVLPNMLFSALCK